ncbi:MAG: hypothetical protein ACI85O_000127, partial [Saprospiraceae bacterium]
LNIRFDNNNNVEQKWHPPAPNTLYLINTGFQAVFYFAAQ